MSTTTVPARTARAAGSTARARVVAVVLAVGAIGLAGLALWHPPEATVISYAEVAPMREAWWAWRVFGGFVGLAVGSVALGLAVCQLAPRSGAGWATTGAVLTGLGGMAAFGGVAGESIVHAYVTDPAVLDAVTGERVMAAVNADPTWFVALLLPGVLLLAVGPLLLAVALWRARAMPRWFAVAFPVVNVLTFVVPGPDLLVDALNVAFCAGMLAIAAAAWRAR